LIDSGLPSRTRWAGPESQIGCEPRSAFLLSDCDLPRRAPDDPLPASGDASCPGSSPVFHWAFLDDRPNQPEL